MSTKIDWADETINPQGWGCWGPEGRPERPKACSYCYAKRMANRGLRDCDLCRQFIPHWHPETMEFPYRWKKPRRIFWQSMGDLLHLCTPSYQIESVLAVVEANPRHTHIFLTKNPARYAEFNPWPSNCWLGTTITKQADADSRVPELLQTQAKILFVSAEPLMGPVNIENWFYPGGRSGRKCSGCGLSWGHDAQINIGLPAIACSTNVNWLIIGAMTGPGAVKVKPEWVRSLWEQGRSAGVSVFMKDNLKSIMGTLVQEFPR